MTTTVLAALSASGSALPPLIIFQGLKVQSTWRPSIPPTHEFYPWIYANDSGWMKADVFSKWFVEWENKSRTLSEDGNLEPRLMIYDGHLSHMDYATIKHAKENNVIILKLPPHTTDLLQPLDVSVFKSLKEKWGKVLFQRLCKTRSTLSRSEFSNTLSTDEVWKAAFTTESIQNGFRK